jgi:hypothetical protein
VFRTSGNPTAKSGGAPDPAADNSDFATEIAEMITDQAPRLFAVVMEQAEQATNQVAAWGMALDDHAYMASVDGKNQFVLQHPDNALKYVRNQADATPHLIWVTPYRT